MKIIQLSDSHIGRETDVTSGIDVRRNFEFLLEKVVKEKPDLLVHTGDICYETPEENIYNWAKKKLITTNLPFSIIAGNHDDSAMMCNIFYQKPNIREYYYTLTFQNNKLIFLDTCNGDMSDEQYYWLEIEIKSTNNIIIFMHHPPIKMGVPFMDNKYAFKSSEKFCKLFDTITRPITIFCGHYHHERTVRRHPLEINICPSTYYELNDFNENFAISNDHIGYRVINIDNFGNVTSATKYFKGFTLPLLA